MHAREVKIKIYSFLFWAGIISLAVALLRWEFEIRNKRFVPAEFTYTYSALSPPFLIQVRSESTAQPIFYYNADDGSLPMKVVKQTDGTVVVTFSAQKEKQ